MLIPVSFTRSPLDAESKRALLDSTHVSADRLADIAKQNRARYPNGATVAWIQASLGLAPDDCDGKLGPVTVAAIITRQRELLRESTGLLDTELLETFATDQDDIPDSPNPPPRFTKSRAAGERGYYDRAFDPADPACGAWPCRDDQWEEVTATGSWLAAMLRQLTGRSVSSRDRAVTYSRSPDDFITLDTYSIGIAHWWADTAPTQILAPLAERLPELAVEAWGKAGALLILDPQALKAVTGKATGHTRYNPRTLSWLAAGWWHIARRPEVIAFCVERWLAEYVSEALGIVRDLKVPLEKLDAKSAGLVLAAIARMCNSGPALAREVVRRNWRPSSSPASIIDALRHAFTVDRAKGGYSKDGNGPGRWRELERNCRVPVSRLILQGRFAEAVGAELNLGVPQRRAVGRT